ncbi:zinc finger protein 414 [Cyclopterus lumpus]|uniref:C2H2-type domain-containing protein n=1 Tax=Cyclopterus lumpus TaxID=8103 RepID=A0A8C2WGC5_CYCLU|nr:zinc finger protein 414 [Cyclopterus lumpus]
MQQVAETESAGKERTSCPLHGCKRMYSDTAALESHVKDHEISAQSLPGKVLLCSTVGCSGSFPDMQKLMEHMRHHHKPNIFFLCESCRTKLRSYRGLLTHLHTCSKVSRGRPKPLEPAAAPAAVTDLDPKPPLLDPVSTPQPLPSEIPKTESSFLAAVLDTDPAPPLLGPPFLSNPETSPPHLAPLQLTEAASQPWIKSEPSDLPLSLNLDGPTAAPVAPDAQGQHLNRARSPEPVYPAPGPAPRSPPGSATVWKKGQGACSRRILWEHTKGRYTCVQCGHLVTNRKEMTHHISTRHSGSQPVDNGGGSASSQPVDNGGGSAASS